MTYLITLLVISILLNIFTIWYLKETIQRLLFVSRNIGDLMVIAMDFKDHIKQVSELELFYGDETIVNLIKHTKFLVEEIDKFKDIFSLSDDDEEEDLDDIGNTETREENKEKEAQAWQQ
jgi:hypothetical protein